MIEKSCRMSRFVIPSLVMAAAALAAEPPGSLLRLERSLDAMGTTYTVAVYGADRFVLEDAVDAALEDVRRLDQLLSNYRPESEWSQVNRNAAIQPVVVSPELFNLLAACIHYSSSSEGAFDITVGPLMKVWGFYKGSERVPHRAEIRTAMERIGYTHVHLDPSHRTVSFDRAGVEIDPGGIGKGYAVDRVAEILKNKGITSGFISAGRSSLYAIGAPPKEPQGWRVSIADPKDSQTPVAEVFLRDESMSTSGTSERFFVAGGVTYSHIMDPRTGYPAQGMLSVSVISPKTIDSEAWTKPYFVLGKDWTIRHKPKDFRVFLCEDRTESRCVSLP
jgi:FAD:protein FMN transferase